jgi:hypothetical protein
MVLPLNESTEKYGILLPLSQRKTFIFMPLLSQRENFARVLKMVTKAHTNTTSMYFGLDWVNAE